MAIFLMILKIIGIILLCILGLILLILLLVLFAPFHYKMAAEYVDESGDYGADVSVRWLFIKLMADIAKGQKLDYTLNIFGIQIYPKKPKKRKETDKKQRENVIPEESQSDEIIIAEALPEADEKEKPLPEEKGIEVKDADNEVLKEKANEFKDAEKEELSEKALDVKNTDKKVISDKALDVKNTDKKVISDKALEVKDTEKKVLKKNAFDIKSTKLRENKTTADEVVKKKGFSEIDPGDPVDKLDEIINSIADKMHKASKKVSHIEQFLDKPYTQKTIKRGKKILARLLKSVKPKKSRGWVHYGLSNPADTGMILGKMSMFFPIYGKWLQVQPDFEYQTIEGNLNLKGRIYLGPIAIPGLIMVLGKDFKKTKSLAEKI